jgi:DNA-binding XRE family transcriptional regulator
LTHHVETRTKTKLPKMTAEQRAMHQRAVAEEAAGKEENIAAARSVAKKLKAERKAIAELVAQLRDRRVKAGVSLNELAARTGIQKSALSRLENSAAPNPTMVTLQRYAKAMKISIEYVVTSKQ